MSPEQLREEEVDTRSDIFSFGVVLYEMLTGEHPFKKTQHMETASSTLQNDPPPLSRYLNTVPPVLQHSVRKMLAKDPDRRYQLIHNVRTDLRQVLAEAAQSQRDEPSLGRGKRMLWGAVAMLVVFVMVFVGWWLFRGETTVVAPEQITSIAVLPLDNLMGDSQQEYFVEGMHEALITNLSKIEALKVISRTSVMRYKEREKSVPEIARELGADAVIEGSVLRAGDQVRITAQLVQAETDTHLWAESYDRHLRNVLELHSQVAQAIAQEIKVKLTPQEQARLASTPSVNPAAQEAYLRGRYSVYGSGAGGAQEGIDYARQAIEIDPGYAPAYALLAESYYQYSWRPEAPQREVISKAREAAATALKLDDTLTEAHVALGNLLMVYDWDWSGAEKEHKRAIELNPNLRAAHEAYGWYLLVIGRPNEALREARRALELDPFSVMLTALQAASYIRVGQYEEAIEQCRKALGMDPTQRVLLRWLGFAYVGKGMYEEAIAEFEKLKTLDPDVHFLGDLGYAYAVASKRGEARKILDEMERSKRGHSSSFSKAVVYAGLGEKNRAFEWLEKAYQDREPVLVSIKFYAPFDTLHSDARYEDLLRRMGLEP